jgi:hypothetical protein
MAITTYRLATLPTNGKVANFDPTTGAGKYTPNQNFMGIDYLTYDILCDGQKVDTARVSFLVRLTPDNVKALCSAYAAIAKLLLLDYKRAEVIHILEEAFDCIGIKCDINAVVCGCYTST